MVRRALEKVLWKPPLAGLSIAMLCAAGAQAGVVAHWSFDSSSLTTDSGNITGAADDTANHNAFVDTVTGVGTHNGSPTVSAAFPTSDSVPGAFGEALMFNGNNYMEFPELTELMAASGAPSFTVSMWVNIPSTVTPANAYTTMSDWGNASSDGATNAKYVYAFGPNDATHIRMQTRSGTGNGTDIVQATKSVAATNDGTWHMLSWTFDTSSGNVESYFDGADLGSTTASGSSLELANAASLFGTFGLKGDGGSFVPDGTELDEVWVFDNTLSGDQISSLHATNVIPEPGSLALLAGVSVLTLRRRRSA